MVQELLADLQRHLNETRGLEAVAKWSLPSELWAAKQLSCWKKHLEFPVAEATPWSPVSRCFMLRQVANSLHLKPPCRRNRVCKRPAAEHRQRGLWQRCQSAFGKDPKTGKIAKKDSWQLNSALCYSKYDFLWRERSENSRKDSFCENFQVGFEFVKFENHWTPWTPLPYHWGHWSWADFWSSWQQLNLSGNLDTDSNSEFMNASTGIGTNIQTKIRRAFRAAKAMVATIVKLAFFPQTYTHLCTCMECICIA